MTSEQAMNLALTHHKGGRLSEAERIYRQILEKEPKQADALHMLGVIGYQALRHAEALDLIRRAIALRPEVGDYYCNLGLVLAAMGMLEQAMAAYQQCIVLEPLAYEAYFDLGNALVKLGRIQEAISAYRHCLTLKPDHVGACNALGAGLRAVGRLDEAIGAYRKAISIQPENSRSYHNLANLLREQGESDQAMRILMQAVDKSPGQVESLLRLAEIPYQQGDLEQAVEFYRRAIAAQPGLAAAHVQLGLILLLRENFAEGWREFEWRWQTPEMARRQEALGKARWDGTDLMGRRILLHAERGFGDTIHFVRYLPEVARRGGRIVFACQPELEKLLRPFKQIEEWVAPGEELPEFAVHCSLVSLPAVLDVNAQNIPVNVPYLFADEAIVKRWRQRMVADGKLNVGLAWSGQINPLQRHLSISDLAPLAGIEGVRFYSLHKCDSPAERIEPPKDLDWIDWSSEFSDFSDTAGLIENMDLVLSVDTSVGHLAGAMGKPTWVILKSVPDWRWLRERADSPWYPTMRLFRQARRGDWSAPMAQAAAALKTLVARRG